MNLSLRLVTEVTFSLCSLDSVDAFKSILKTHLFLQAC